MLVSAFSWVYLFLFPLPFASTLFSAVCKAFSDNHFTFLHFFFGINLVPASLQCYEPLSIDLQALCVADLIPWICLSPPLYNHKRFDNLGSHNSLDFTGHRAQEICDWKFRSCKCPSVLPAKKASTSMSNLFYLELIFIGVYGQLVLIFTAEWYKVQNRIKFNINQDSLIKM